MSSRLEPTAKSPGSRGPTTRTRILVACRDLFNARGPDRVTTAEIAGAVGIAEGNLHYHFQRKEQIVDALFEDFAEDTRRVAVSYGDKGADLSDAYLAAWFNLMWEWRFFYRDGASVFTLAPSLRSRLRTLADESQRHVRGALEAMVAAGLLTATPEQIAGLIVNSWIVSTYWLDYLRTIRGVTEIKRQHINWGAAQMQSLFTPYLTPEGRERLGLRG